MRAQQPVEVLQHGGLSRPRVADNADDLASLHLHVHAEERLHLKRRAAHVVVDEVADIDDAICSAWGRGGRRGCGNSSRRLLWARLDPFHYRSHNFVAGKQTRGETGHTFVKVSCDLRDLRHVEVELAQPLGLGKQLARRPLQRNAPLIHDDDAVGRKRLAHEVGNGHHRHTLLVVQTRDHSQHFGAALRVEHGGGFVEHEHVGAHGQDAGNADALLLPAREKVGRTVAQIAQFHLAQRPVYARDHLVARHAQILGAEGDILLHHCRHNLVIGLLKDHAHCRADVAQSLLVARVPAFHPNLTRIGQEQPVEVARERGLA